MKRFCKLFMTILLLNIIYIPQVYAADTCGKITGSFIYDKEKFNDEEVSLYLIADYDEKANKFSFKNEFKDFTLDVNSLTYGELEEYSLTLKKYIEDNSINSSHSVKTNDNNQFIFDKCLEKGLYLVKTEDIIKDKFKYISLPSILTIPTITKEDANHIYDIEINMKVEVKNLDDNNPTDPDNPNNPDKPIDPDDPNKPNSDGSNNGSDIKIPNTFDAIYIYLSLFIGSLILIILIIYLNQKKKGRKENEKNK